MVTEYRSLSLGTSFLKLSFFLFKKSFIQILKQIGRIKLLGLTTPTANHARIKCEALKLINPSPQ